MVNDFVQQRKLDKLMSFCEKNISGECDALFVAGSYVHSRDFAIKPTSDIDMVVLSGVDGVADTISGDLYVGGDLDVCVAMDLYSKGVVDVVSTRHSVDGALFTVHYMTKETFSGKFASLNPSELVSFRAKYKDYVYSFFNFAGESVEEKVRNEAFRGGFLVFTKTCFFMGGHYFGGSAHNKLMSEPLVVFDRCGLVERGVFGLRKGLVGRIVEEYGWGYDFGRYSVVNTLIRHNQGRISPEVEGKLFKYEFDVYELLRKEYGVQN